MGHDEHELSQTGCVLTAYQLLTVIKRVFVLDRVNERLEGLREGKQDQRDRQRSATTMNSTVGSSASFIKGATFFKLSLMF